MPRHPLVLALLVATTLVASACSTVATPSATPTPSHTPSTEEDADFGTLTVYEVAPQAQLRPVPEGTAAAPWDMFVRVAGADAIDRRIVAYRTGDAPDSDTLAAVSPASDDLTAWNLSVNLAYSDDSAQLLTTLIHEYAHVLSLDADQLDPEASSCTTLSMSEGCARAESYILAFHREFWAAYGDAAPTPDSDDREAGASFYAAHEEDFVSDYAATNVTEDLAESFASYVREDIPDADTVIARKLRFFDRYPELAKIRSHIRGEFAL